MKNLIIFIPSIESAGVEKNFFTLSNYFSHKIDNIYLITANTNHKFKLKKKIKIISPKSGFWNNKPRIIKCFICLFLILKTFRIRNSILFSFQSNLFAAIISKIYNFKLIIRLNTSPNKYIDNIYKKFFFRLIYNSADEVIVNSKKFKKILKEKLNIDSSFIYNPASKIHKFKKLNNKLIKHLKILNIGRLTDQKDQNTMLKSMNLLKANKIPFKATIIGAGEKYNELKKYIVDMNLQKMVKLTGFKKEAFKYIRFANLFILSSKYEGLPNVLIEAQQIGVPIISTDCPTGPREILMNGKLGVLVPVGNYEKLYNEIKRYYLDSKVLINKSKLAKKYLKRFDKIDNCEKYYKLINKHLKS